MRTILVSMLWCSFALAAKPLEDLDRTRVTQLPDDEGGASLKLKAWADAIARADKEVRHKEGREVVEFEKGLYGIAYKGYEGIVACKKSDEACDAAIAAIKTSVQTFSTANRGKRLWDPYLSTLGALEYNMPLAAKNARASRKRADENSAWDAAFNRATEAGTARTAAYAAATPEADEATLRNAIAKANEVDAACAELRNLPRRDNNKAPEVCPAFGYTKPTGLETRSMIINRLPAGPEFSNASRCVNTCKGPLQDAVVAVDFQWGAVDAYPKVRALFETVHPSRYHYLTRDVRDEGELVANRGEVVLIKADLVTPEKVRVVTLDNRHLEVAPTFLTDKPIKGAKLLTTKPNDFTVVREVEGKLMVVGTSWDSIVENEPPEGEPPFLRLMDPASKDYEQFVKASDNFLACFDKTMKKLDPDGTAWKYERETYSLRTGKTLKVENYGKALQRQACNTCGCKKFNGTRVAAANKVLAPFRKELAATYAASVAVVGKRVSAL